MRTHIKMSEFGIVLGTRLFAREITENLPDSQSKELVLDFDGVRSVSLSFATELIQFLETEYGKSNFELINLRQNLQNNVIKIANNTIYSA